MLAQVYRHRDIRDGNKKNHLSTKRDIIVKTIYFKSTETVCHILKYTSIYEPLPQHRACVTVYV